MKNIKPAHADGPDTTRLVALRRGHDDGDVLVPGGTALEVDGCECAGLPVAKIVEGY